MSLKKEPLLTFSRFNLRRVEQSIRKNLTPDLLPKKWVALNEKNTMFGHCHTASGVLYEIFRSENLHMYRAKDDSYKLVNEEMYHWFILNRHTDEIIDITSLQYSNHPRLLKKLYKVKVKSSILGFGYRKRVHTLLDRVRMELGF